MARLIVLLLAINLASCSSVPSICNEYGNAFAIENKVIKKHCLEKHRH